MYMDWPRNRGLRARPGKLRPAEFFARLALPEGRANLSAMASRCAIPGFAVADVKSISRALAENGRFPLVGYGDGNLEPLRRPGPRRHVKPAAFLRANRMEGRHWPGLGAVNRAILKQVRSGKSHQFQPACS